MRPNKASGCSQFAILGVGQVLVGWAVAVVGKRHALAGGALASGRATLRRRAADGGIALERMLGDEPLGVVDVARHDLDDEGKEQDGKTKRR